MSHASELARYIRGVIATIGLLVAQVTEGDVEVLNVREVDERLGPLVLSLVGLGIAALILTTIYWWFTRPRAEIDRPGDDTGSAGRAPSGSGGE